MSRKSSQYFVPTQNGTRIYVKANGILPILKGVNRARESTILIEKMLEQRIEQRDELLKNPETSPEQIKYLDDMIANLRGTLARKAIATENIKKR